jgi:hypothetical protein
MEKFNNMENKQISEVEKNKAENLNSLSVLVEDAIEMAVKSGAMLRASEEIKQAWLKLSGSMLVREIDDSMKLGLERKFGNPAIVQKAINAWDLLKNELSESGIITKKEEAPAQELIPNAGVRADAEKWLSNALMSFEDYINTFASPNKVGSNPDFKEQINKLQSFYNGYSQGGTKLDEFKKIVNAVLDEQLAKDRSYKNNPKLVDQAKVIIGKALESLTR